MLVHSSASTDSSPLTRQLLRATLRIERKISDAIAARRVPCLRWPDGQCLVVSPSMFWHHEERALATDANVRHTLRPSNNISFAGVPIQSQMVVAWRDNNEYSSVDAGSTVFLALTYFFPEKDCFGKTGHSVWRQILEDVSKDGADLIIETQQPKLIALEVCHAKYTLWARSSRGATVHDTQILFRRYLSINCIHLLGLLWTCNYFRTISAQRSSCT